MDLACRLPLTNILPVWCFFVAVVYFERKIKENAIRYMCAPYRACSVCMCLNCDLSGLCNRSYRLLVSIHTRQTHKHTLTALTEADTRNELMKAIDEEEKSWTHFHVESISNMNGWGIEVCTLITLYWYFNSQCGSVFLGK